MWKYLEGRSGSRVSCAIKLRQLSKPQTYVFAFGFKTKKMINLVSINGIVFINRVITCAEKPYQNEGKNRLKDFLLTRDV